MWVCEWWVGGVWVCEWWVGGCEGALYQYAHNLCCSVRCSLLGQVECLIASFDSILHVLHLQLAVEEGTEGGKGGEGRGAGKRGKKEWEGRGGKGREGRRERAGEAIHTI